MTSRTFGILWRPSPRKANSQLLTIMDNGNFFWSHAKRDNSLSFVFREVDLVQVIIKGAIKDGGYWVGPREMSGWGND